MLKLIDLVYFSNNDCNSPEEVLAKHKPALGFVDHIKNKADISLVKHCNYEGIASIDNIEYAFFRRSNRFFHVPFKTHTYIRHQNPDVVIVNGLVFPVQTIALKLRLGKKTLVIAQHHGEVPFSGIKRIFQKLADKFIDGYFFSAKENAEEWILKGVIKREKCFEVLAGSTSITKSDKVVSKSSLQFTGRYNFLWVGRLIEVKDPITVLVAFRKYTTVNPETRLYMIYQDDTILEKVKSFIDMHKLNNIFLVGFIPNNELSMWYSAADFFIAGSRRESLGYALLEAMACGCIPVVTDIPSFRKNTAEGKYGYLFETGNPDSLFQILCSLDKVDVPALSNEVQRYFCQQLSYQKLIDDLLAVCNQLSTRQ